MSEIVLFHSALGLRPGVQAFADGLRAAGHTVHTPDYYDGEVFDDLDDGVAKRDAVGIEELAARARAAVGPLPADVVYAGFSLGTALAQLLAQTRPGARGALLLHGALAPEELGAWPAGLPVAIHGMDRDPWFEIDAAEALAAAADDGELHLYPGDGHLFADPGSPDHDPAAAALMLERSLAALERW